MRATLLASITSLALIAAVPAFAQTSTSASNIDKADTRSDIAPALPVPPVGPNSGPRQFVTVAHTALQDHRTGEAQEALERAETRALDVANNPDAPGAGEARAMIHSISDARQALGRGDIDEANRDVEAALATPAASQSTASNPAPGMTAASAQPTTVTPMVSSNPNAAIPWQEGQKSETFHGKDDAEQTVSGSVGVQNTFTRTLPAGHEEGVGPGADTAGVN